MVQRRRGISLRLHVPAWPRPHFLLWTWTRNPSDLPQRPCPSRHCQRYPMGKAAPYRWAHFEQLASGGPGSSLGCPEVEIHVVLDNLNTHTSSPRQGVSINLKFLSTRPVTKICFYMPV